MKCVSDQAVRTHVVKAGVGKDFSFVQGQLDPWVVLKDGDTGKAQLAQACGTFTFDGSTLIVTFPDKIVFTCGACLDLEVSNECEACPTCKTEKVELTEDTRFVVLDDNDCPTQHVTWEQICAFIAEQACIRVCEQLCQMPLQTSVGAGLKLVGVNQEKTANCQCVLIPASALQCDPVPDPFCCGDEPCN